jgi:hypothetical protein
MPHSMKNGPSPSLNVFQAANLRPKKLIWIPELEFSVLEVLFRRWISRNPAVESGCLEDQFSSMDTAEILLDESVLMGNKTVLYSLGDFRSEGSLCFLFPLHGLACYLSR